MRLSLVLCLISMGAATAYADTVCKPDRYQENVLRCDNGEVWRRDRYGPPTWRSTDGTVIRQDRYGGSWRVEKPADDDK
jgi:hypothetical protein